MPSFNTVKRIYNNGSPTTIGRQLKQMSDDVMQETWDNDIQTRTCYIYDYFHDNDKASNHGYIPNTDSGKIKVDLKFIIKAYKTAEKDDPEYHVQFEPDLWNGNDLIPQWFKDGYGKYGVDFPMGLFCDIPDDRGEYWKWLIFYNENANQFPKFGCVKCNYKFQWVEDDGVHRYKRQMWGVERTQSSYTSGVWTGHNTQVYDEQGKFILPWNSVSMNIEHDMRIFISMFQAKPYVYQITKVDNTSPRGIVTFTVKQKEFNKTTDLVQISDENGIEMYADWYKNGMIEPETPDEQPVVEENTDTLTIKVAKGEIKASSSNYKVLTATCNSADGIDITSEYEYEWKYMVGEEELLDEMIVPITSEDTLNKIKIRLLCDVNYVGKVLSVKCIGTKIEDETVSSIESTIKLDITA